MAWNNWKEENVRFLFPTPANVVNGTRILVALRLPSWSLARFLALSQLLFPLSLFFSSSLLLFSLLLFLSLSRPSLSSLTLFPSLKTKPLSSPFYFHLVWYFLFSFFSLFLFPFSRRGEVVAAAALEISSGEEISVWKYFNPKFPRGIPGKYLPPP